jgi:hypothetical protein
MHVWWWHVCGCIQSRMLLGVPRGDVVCVLAAAAGMPPVVVCMATPEMAWHVTPVKQCSPLPAVGMLTATTRLLPLPDSWQECQ